jgi:hypothetical protein
MKNSSFAAGLGLGFGRCQFCKQILKYDFNSFTVRTHMFSKHHDVVKKNILHALEIMSYYKNVINVAK